MHEKQQTAYDAILLNDSTEISDNVVSTLGAVFIFSGLDADIVVVISWKVLTFSSLAADSRFNQLIRMLLDFLKLLKMGFSLRKSSVRISALGN